MWSFNISHLPKSYPHLDFPYLLLSHQTCTPINNGHNISKVRISKLHLFSLKISLYACTSTIVLSSVISSLKIIPNMWKLVFYLQQRQPLKYMCIFELLCATIWPYRMSTKWYIPSCQLIIEQLEVVLHIMDVVGSIITYIEVNLFKYHPLLFTTTWTMPISDMYHYAHLIWMIVLTLYLIFWL